VTSAAEMIRMSDSTRQDRTGRDGMDIVTAFVSQALHVLNYLQDLGHVGG
jgi:hypothetical protein